MTRETATERLGFEDDAIDPELLALDAPPRGLRHALLGLMALAAASAIALAAMVRLDVAYVFEDRTPTELGAATALDGLLATNRFVRVEGLPMVSAAVTYTRVVGSQRYVVYPLAGQRNLYVQVPIGDGPESAAYGRREFEGRLVSMGELGGRFETIRRYMARRVGLPVTADSYLLLADEEPLGSVWAIGLVLVAFALVGTDVWLIRRWFRPLPGAERGRA